MRYKHIELAMTMITPAIDVRGKDMIGGREYEA